MHLAECGNEKGKNIVQMGDDINRVLEEFKKELPSEVNMYRITDQAQVVGDSVYDFCVSWSLPLWPW